MAELLDNLFYYEDGDKYTDEMFEKMWVADPLQFINISFYLRSYRTRMINFVKIKGRGKRKIFYQIIVWMSYHHLPELLKLLGYIPDLGYWKDLLILMGTPAENAVIDLFAKQLIKDYRSYNNPEQGLISLAAKWTPSEHSHYDKLYATNKKIALRMGVSKKILRQKYLVPLRKYLSITEQLISAKKWETINYRLLPYRCLRTYHQIFLKYDADRYLSYLSSLPSYNIPLTWSEILDIPAKDSNQGTVVALEISPAMWGLAKFLGAQLITKLAAKEYLLFDPYNNDSNNNIVREKSDIVNIIEEKGPGGNLVQIINFFTDIEHLIIINNTLINIEEFLNLPNLNYHITYWTVTERAVKIKDYPQITIIEGYDIQIYRELILGNIITSKYYKEIIISKIGIK